MKWVTSVPSKKSVGTLTVWMNFELLTKTGIITTVMVAMKTTKTMMTSTTTDVITTTITKKKKLSVPTTLAVTTVTTVTTTIVTLTTATATLTAEAITKINIKDVNATDHLTTTRVIVNETVQGTGKLKRSTTRKSTRLRNMLVLSVTTTSSGKNSLRQRIRPMKNRTPLRTVPPRT
eukprot:PhF_6_TR37892/c0_g1_i1/m.56564